MAEIQVRWMLEIEGFSERGEDEVGLQFALVTIFDGEVRVDTHRVTNLFPSGGFAPLPDEVNEDGKRHRAQGTMTRRNVPTTRNPYLGFVARGIEEDSSTNRDGDNDRFEAAIREASEGVVAAGGVPGTNDLWTAGHNAELEDRWWLFFDQDDDDRVSTSVRAFPEFGSRLNEALGAELTTREGGVVLPGPDESFVATYVGEGQSSGARYQMRVWISLVTNGSPAPDTQQWGWTPDGPGFFI